tara:strand:- start:189 stop:593 length:405 start_codon:yes stop_codon:yes gene_type:complete
MDSINNFLVSEHFTKLKQILHLEHLENFYVLVILSGIFFLFVLLILYFVLFRKETINVINKTKPTLNEIVNKVDSKIDSNKKYSENENDFIDVLVAIEEEMAAIRELYVGGYITKGIYISETDRLYEKAKVFGL